MPTKHLSIPFAFLGIAGLMAFALIRDEPRDTASVPGTDGPRRTHIVELRAEGFSPAELTVEEGDTVEFINRSSPTKFFWPASDFHPTHGIYPEFDPREPIPQNRTWKFTFTRASSWGYHDHVAPYFTGRITVRERAPGDAAADGCSSRSRSQRESCWNLMLARALKSDGVAGAFAALARLYQTEPDFIADGCHRQAHIIGEAAYAEYRKHRDWSKVGFGPETIYCNYGYYHGIFEHLFRDRPGDLDLVEELCAELERQLSGTIPRIRQNCFHGAGHGFMPDPPPRETWGEPKAMTAPALANCARLKVRDEGETRECYEGIFNVMADWMNSQKYGLAMPTNPLDFCRGQDARAHELACYYEYGMRIHDEAGNDLVKIAERFVNGIADDEIARMVMGSAASTVIESTLERENHDDTIIACRSLASRLRESCLNGVLGGLVAHGEPGREHVKVLQFCASPVLVPDERNFCYRSAFGKFRQVYLPDELKRLCTAIPSSYRQLCNE